MAELNSQQPQSVAGGTTTFNEPPGSPLKVVPHNLLHDVAFNEDEDALAVEVFRSENDNVADSVESRCIRVHVHIKVFLFIFSSDSSCFFFVFLFFSCVA
ncbi:hypothetical protein Hanom_Chr04g00333371 [Helianthus anomalus]